VVTPGASPYVFFRVDDIDAALDRVRELGGQVEEMDIEGDDEKIARFGRFKLCRDDQGVELRPAPAAERLARPPPQAASASRAWATASAMLPRQGSP